MMRQLWAAPSFFSGWELCYASMEPNQEYTQVPDLVMNWEKHAEGGGLMQQTKGTHSTAYERFVYVNFKLLFIPYLYTLFIYPIW